MSLTDGATRALMALGGVVLAIGVPVAGVELARRGDAPASTAAKKSAAAAAIDDGRGDRGRAGGRGAGGAGGAGERAPDDEADEAGEAAVANDFPAVLLLPRMASLTPRADRKVLAVLVQAGEPVRKGEVIVAFDLREIAHELAMAEAQLAAARADAASGRAARAAARGKVARRDATVLVKGRRIALVSGEEAAEARFEADAAGARLQSAAARVAEHRARVAQLRLALEENELRAPFDGVVADVSFEAGATARPGDVVARIVGGCGLRARIAVPEEAGALIGARRARIAVGDRTLAATVRHVTAEPEPVSRVFIVEATVDAWASACAGHDDQHDHDGARGAGPPPADCVALAGRAARASLEAAAP